MRRTRPPPRCPGLPPFPPAPGPALQPAPSPAWSPQLPPRPPLWHAPPFPSPPASAWTSTPTGSPRCRPPSRRWPGWTTCPCTGAPPGLPRCSAPRSAAGGPAPLAWSRRRSGLPLPPLLVLLAAARHRRRRCCRCCPAAAPASCSQPSLACSTQPSHPSSRSNDMSLLPPEIGACTALTWLSLVRPWVRASWCGAVLSCAWCRGQHRQDGAAELHVAPGASSRCQGQPCAQLSYPPALPHRRRGTQTSRGCCRPARPPLQASLVTPALAPALPPTSPHPPAERQQAAGAASGGGRAHAHGAPQPAHQPAGGAAARAGQPGAPGGAQVGLRWAERGLGTAMRVCGGWAGLLGAPGGPEVGAQQGRGSGVVRRAGGQPQLPALEFARACTSQLLVWRPPACIRLPAPPCSQHSP